MNNRKKILFSSLGHPSNPTIILEGTLLSIWVPSTELSNEHRVRPPKKLSERVYFIIYKLSLFV